MPEPITIDYRITRAEQRQASQLLASPKWPHAKPAGKIRSAFGYVVFAGLVALLYHFKGGNDSFLKTLAHLHFIVTGITLAAVLLMVVYFAALSTIRRSLTRIHSTLTISDDGLDDRDDSRHTHIDWTAFDSWNETSTLLVLRWTIKPGEPARGLVIAKRLLPDADSLERLRDLLATHLGSLQAKSNATEPVASPDRKPMSTCRRCGCAFQREFAFPRPTQCQTCQRKASRLRAALVVPLAVALFFYLKSQSHPKSESAPAEHEVQPAPATKIKPVAPPSEIADVRD